MASRTYNVLAGVSLALCPMTVGLWAISFWSPSIPYDPATGVAQFAPPHAIPIPEPSDADEYLVLHRGNFERWEFAPWDRKWYRFDENFPILFLSALLLILPASWLTRRWLGLTERDHMPHGFFE